MTKQLLIEPILGLLFCLLLWMLAMPTQAADIAGNVTLVNGAVTISESGGSGRQAGIGDVLHAGDGIITGADGELQAELEDGGMIAVRPNSVFRIDGYRANGDEQDSSVFSLLKGAVRSVTGFIGKVTPPNYRINTPTATIGVRGTDHEVIVIADADAGADEVAGTHDRVYEGATIIEANGSRLEIVAGKAGFLRSGPGARLALHDGIPRFIERRRSQRDARLEERNRRIGEVIEKKLRQRGKLRDGESLREMIQRRRAAGDGNRELMRDRHKQRQEHRRRHQERQ